MDHKIKFLDDFSMDRKLYWRVGDVYGRYDWEIMYEKDRPDGAWRVRRSGGDVWFTVDGKNLFCELSARQIDVSDFDRQLCSNILTQAIFSSSLFEEAKKILGEQTISEAIIQHNQFAEELLKMIKDLTGTSSNHQSVYNEVSHSQSAENQYTAPKTGKTGSSAVDSSTELLKDTSGANQLFVPSLPSNSKDQKSLGRTKSPLVQSGLHEDNKTNQISGNKTSESSFSKNSVSNKSFSDSSSKSQKQSSHHSSKGPNTKLSSEGKKPWLRLVKD